VIAVPTLETYAFQDENYRGCICPLLDARLSSVYAMAYRAGERETRVNDSEELLPGKEGGGLSSVLLDAGAYEYDVFTEMLDTSLSSPAARDMAGNGIRIYGDGLEAMRPESRERFEAMLAAHSLNAEIMPDDRCPRDASHVAAWAYAYGEPVPYATIEPLYIRKAEAQRRLDAGLLKPHS
jgi:tRNA A37 threonylcarbamoyladenosine modification protein TsaB